MRRFPRYPRKPYKSRYARITLNGQEILLGAFGSAESWKAYNELLAQWTANGGPVGSGSGSGPVRLGPVGSRTVGEAVAAWFAHAAERCNRDGSKPWNEIPNYKHAVRPLLALFRQQPAAEFGPRALKQVQQAMATGQWKRLANCEQTVETVRTVSGWSRRVCDRNTNRIKTIFRWAESEELVPAGTYAALATVGGLRKGQYGVREKAKVPPAPADAVEACLPHLNHCTRAMIQLLQLCGCRPGELCRMTPGHILRGRVQVAPGSWADLGACWVAVFGLHKTGNADDGDTPRYVLLGPRAQAILEPFMDRPADMPLFSPREAVEQLQVEKRQRRVSKVPPSQRDRSVRNPRRPPGERYTVFSLNKAVRRACEKAGIRHWSPGQLRHNAITAFGAEGDAEAARIAAGHANLATTRIYLVDSLKRAAELLGKVG